MIYRIACLKFSDGEERYKIQQLSWKGWRIVGKNPFGEKTLDAAKDDIARMKATKIKFLYGKSLLK